MHKSEEVLKVFDQQDFVAKCILTAIQGKARWVEALSMDDLQPLVNEIMEGLVEEISSPVQPEELISVNLTIDGKRIREVIANIENRHREVNKNMTAEGFRSPNPQVRHEYASYLFLCALELIVGGNPQLVCPGGLCVNESGELYMVSIEIEASMLSHALSRMISRNQVERREAIMKTDLAKMLAFAETAATYSKLIHDKVNDIGAVVADISRVLTVIPTKLDLIFKQVRRKPKKDVEK